MREVLFGGSIWLFPSMAPRRCSHIILDDIRKDIELAPRGHRQGNVTHFACSVTNMEVLALGSRKGQRSVQRRGRKAPCNAPTHTQESVKA